MSKKYRQRGYQDDDRVSRMPQPPDEDQRKRGPRLSYGQREPRKINMPGFREVLKCSRCGTTIALPILFETRCQKCTSDLHSCAQCTWFDTSSRFECSQRILERVSAKGTKNTCASFDAQVTVERETRSVGPRSARQAFDELFK